MTSPIIERIEQAAGVNGLVGLLAERLKPTDRQSLLLEVYRQVAQRRSPPRVLADFESNSFAWPSTISPVRLLDWERVAFAQLPPEFVPLALSPVSPLGTCSAVALVDQNKVLSTIRNTEVLADSTNVLALECARQRRLLLRDNPKSTTAVHRAASHRLLRAQRYDDPYSIPHFSAFALTSAGRDAGNLTFELSTLATHIGFYLRALRAFLGPNLAMRVALTDFNPLADSTDRRALLRERLLNVICADFPDVECVLGEGRTGGRDYYVDLCFHVYAATPAGEMVQLADGGVVNWTQRLLSNDKERCVISGIGSERVCMAFDE